MMAAAVALLRQTSIDVELNKIRAMRQQELSVRAYKLAKESVVTQRNQLEALATEAQRDEWQIVLAESKTRVFKNKLVCASDLPPPPQSQQSHQRNRNRGNNRRGGRGRR